MFGVLTNCGRWSVEAHDGGEVCERGAGSFRSGQRSAGSAFQLVGDTGALMSPLDATLLEPGIGRALQAVGVAPLRGRHPVEGVRRVRARPDRVGARGYRG